jgi:hypothetical protein
MEYSPLLKVRVAVWIARYDRGRASQNSSGVSLRPEPTSQSDDSYRVLGVDV